MSASANLRVLFQADIWGGAFQLALIGGCSWLLEEEVNDRVVTCRGVCTVSVIASGCRGAFIVCASLLCVLSTSSCGEAMGRARFLIWGCVAGVRVVLVSILGA